MVKNLVDLFLHLDKHLDILIQSYGFWSYLILFLIVFCETGLVLTPFFPGDSLLFAAGALAATGSLKIQLVYCLLCLASMGGDSTNYWIGRFIGPKVFHKEKVGFFKKEHLERTHQFYERHGGKTIIIARFIPIIRTFAPFVAGIGKMTYWRFLFYSVFGSIGWVSIFVLCGYFFGNIPFVKNHFSIVIMGIVLVSITPGLFKFIKYWFVRRAERQAKKSI